MMVCDCFVLKKGLFLFWCYKTKINCRKVFDQIKIAIYFILSDVLDAKVFAGVGSDLKKNYN